MGEYPMSESEFFIITSTGVTDFQSLDFSGAKQVLVRSVGTVDGVITKASTGNSTTMLEPYFEIRATDSPTPIGSCDDRLFWVSKTAGISKVQVWVVKA
tara:strand:+ start:886 stop:1182 length:297 start_codon:yes stop_codon:yes gene_type:complete